MQAKAMAHESGKEMAKEISQEVSVTTAPSEVVVPQEVASPASVISPREHIEMANAMASQVIIESQEPQPQSPAVPPPTAESEKV